MEDNWKAQWKLINIETGKILFTGFPFGLDELFDFDWETQLFGKKDIIPVGILGGTGIETSQSSKRKG